MGDYSFPLAKAKADISANAYGLRPRTKCHNLHLFSYRRKAVRHSRITSCVPPIGGIRIKEDARWAQRKNTGYRTLGQAVIGLVASICFTCVLRALGRYQHPSREGFFVYIIGRLKARDTQSCCIVPELSIGFAEACVWIVVSLMAMLLKLLERIRKFLNASGEGYRIGLFTRLFANAVVQASIDFDPRFVWPLAGGAAYQCVRTCARQRMEGCII